MLTSKSAGDFSKPRTILSSKPGTSHALSDEEDIIITDPKKIAKKLPSSRLSLGMANGRVQDIVAIFPQGDPVDPTPLRFMEHVNRTDAKIFSISTVAPINGKEEVKHIGIEEAPGDGYEFVLAIVNRKNGKPIEFKPTALVNFQPRFRPGEELLSGRKRKNLVDYSQDNSVSKDDLQAERRRLTANFGSAKKNKMLEAHIRRSITNETLNAMTSTAFSSTNVLASSTKSEIDGDENEQKDQKTPTISLLNKAVSNVLPAPNYSAKVPSDVYNIDQFLPNNFIEMRERFEAEALKFFQEYDNYQKLIQYGVAPLVAKRVGAPLRYANPGRRCFISLKMLALSKFIQVTFRFRNNWISANELDALEIPPLMLGCIRADFLGDGKNSKNFKLQVATHEKHRALAQLLCLMLLFDEPEYILPISPLVQELGTNENSLKKLLTGMGCVVTVASEAQSVTMNTVRVARLVGPPKMAKDINKKRYR